MRRYRPDDELHAQLVLLYKIIKPVLKKRQHALLEKQEAAERARAQKEQGDWDPALQSQEKRILLKQMFNAEEEGELGKRQERLWKSTLGMGFPKLAMDFTKEVSERHGIEFARDDRGIPCGLALPIAPKVGLLPRERWDLVKLPGYEVVNGWAERKKRVEGSSKLKSGKGKEENVATDLPAGQNLTKVIGQSDGATDANAKDKKSESASSTIKGVRSCASDKHKGSLSSDQEKPETVISAADKTHKNTENLPEGKKIQGGTSDQPKTENEKGGDESNVVTPSDPSAAKKGKSIEG